MGIKYKSQRLELKKSNKMSSSSPPFSLLAQDSTTITPTARRSIPGFTQCFWQANGMLNCQDPTVLPSGPAEPVSQFHTFTTPNNDYAPNAYRSWKSWYDSQNSPCCKLPCNQDCSTDSAANRLMRRTTPPPRGPMKYPDCNGCCSGNPFEQQQQQQQ